MNRTVPKHFLLVLINWNNQCYGTVKWNSCISQMLYSQCKVRRGEVLSLIIHTCQGAKCGYIVYVCLFVCTVTRIKLAASNFAQWLRGILGRESPILGNFAPPKAKNRTNRPVYIYIQTYVYLCECMCIYVCMYVCIYSPAIETPG